MNRKGYGVRNPRRQKMEGHKWAKLGWLWGDSILKLGALGSLGKPQVHSWVCKLFAVTKRRNPRVSRTRWAKG